jgi:HKD family nuclease
MRIQVVNNEDKNVLSILAPAISKADDIRVAVAFVSWRGLAMIQSAIDDALKKDSQIEFLIGLDFATTEPKAVQTLYNYYRNNHQFSLLCFASLRNSALYHPKLYTTRRDDKALAIVGSSNLTEGGMKKNVEINIVIEGDMNDEIISDIYSSYNILKFNEQRVIPDDEYIMYYSELYKIRRNKERKIAKDKHFKKLIKDFEDKTSRLKKPKPSRGDLVGWLDLIYNYSPEGEFTNSEIYKFQEIFQQRYPENKNIKAKIRQQLQILRDMGLIEHKGKARWIKFSDAQVKSAKS